MSDDPVAQALAMEDRRFKAQAASDVVELEAVLADDLRYTHANGMIEDRAEFIRRIASGERKYEDVKLIERTVSKQEGFTVVFGQTEVSVMSKLGLVVNRLDYTAIYRDSDPRLFVWSSVRSRNQPGD